MKNIWVVRAFDDAFCAQIAQAARWHGTTLGDVLEKDTVVQFPNGTVYQLVFEETVPVLKSLARREEYA